jgi:hypothetical protein
MNIYECESMNNAVSLGVDACKHADSKVNLVWNENQLCEFG